MYPTLPNINIQAPYTPTPSRVASSSPLSGVLKKVAGFLAPQPAGPSYESYAAPLRATFDNYANTNFIPEYNQFTYNPAVRQMNNQAAGAYGTGAVMGNTLKRYNDNTMKLGMARGDTLEQQRTGFEDMIRQLFNQDMKDRSNAPSAYNNIGY